MQCPKCKNQIADGVLRCPNCNLKVRIICPECKKISPMGKKFCDECGYQFFIACPNCKTINLSEAKICRKCNTLLHEEPSAEIEKPISDTVAAPIQKSEEIAKTIEIDSDENKVEEVLAQEVPQEENSIEQTPSEEILAEQPPVEEIPKEENSDEAENSSPEELQKEDFEGYFVSSDEVEISETQLKSIIDKVEEIDKNEIRKAEAQDLIRKKFEKQQETDREEEEQIPPEYIRLDQVEAQKAIIDAIQNPIKKVISLCGKEGLGKSLILKYVYDGLRKNENYICAFGECNALTQITPFGYIQDVLLNICNLSNYCINLDDFIKNNTKAMEAKFFNLNPQEINDLFNFLYPFKGSHFNGITKRRDYTISILKKVFENLTIKSTLIFIIDDFENIDGASFNFLKSILTDENLNEKIKILLTNKYNKIAQACFYDIKDQYLKTNNYANIFLSELNKSQCVSLINSLFGGYIDLPKSIENQIYENSKGASVYIEQACQLLVETGAITVNDEQNFIFNHDFDDYILPFNTYRIIEERISSLEINYPLIVNSLYYAGILGNKFSITRFADILSQFLNINEEDFRQICEYLINQNYISQLSENYFTFKNTSIWHYIYEKAKADENYVEFNKNIYTSLRALTLSNNSIKPLLLQQANEKKEAYAHWEMNSKLSSYIGDTTLYVISLKQQLKISNDIPDIITAQNKIHIYEQMGKILYQLSPNEAINYLSAAIAFYKEETNYNPSRIIELSGFLVQSCKKTGNYTGILEACDVALSAVPSGEYTIEKALIASKKAEALLYLGNCEELINLANTELISIMEDALAKSGLSKIVSDDMIFDIWFETLINLATAYAMQGDKRVFEILSKADDSLYENKIVDDSKTRKILLTKALAYTMRGEIKLSSDTIVTITSKYTEDIDQNSILKIDLMNILNRIISKDYNNIVEEMFQTTTFADNINNLFVKNILKLLLGYVIQTKSKNSGKALDIYNEEIVFFTKEKIATGALLSWYLISDVSLISQGVDYSLDIALKALDVAKGPKINNYIFMVALKSLIADMYIIKGDFEAVKMYLEKAMLIAKNNDLRFMQMLLYQSFAKYNIEMMNIYKDNARDFALAAVDMYNNSIKLAQNLLLTAHENTLKKELTAFNVSCQLNKIELNLNPED